MWSDSLRDTYSPGGTTMCREWHVKTAEQKFKCYFCKKIRDMAE